jgi:hypothetical protein
VLESIAPQGVWLYSGSPIWGAKSSLAASQLFTQAKQQLGYSKITKAMLA